jgi:DNA-binding beta-propeller fold protein YncE
MAPTTSSHPCRLWRRLKPRPVIACMAVLGSMVLGAGAADAGTGAARSFSFSPDGGFVNALAAGVDQSNGNVYVSDSGTNRLWEFKVNLAGKSAEPETAFGEEGWVIEPYPPGEPQRRTELNVPFQPAVDGAHNVLVPTLRGGKLYELSPTGGEIELASPITGLAEPTGVGVDGGGNIYVSQLGGAVR